MEILLSHFYKLLSKFIFIFIFIFNCIASQATAKSIHDCDLNWIADHPIKECTDLYEKKISSLTVIQKQNFEDKFKKILDDHKVLWVVYEELAYLFKDYPTSIVLFTKLQINEEIDKANKDDTKKVNADDPVSSEYGDFQFILQQYKILSYMLEKKGKLETEEKNMLSISKQRIQCLGDILDDLSQNFEKSVDKKFIIDKCYQ